MATNPEFEQLPKVTPETERFYDGIAQLLDQKYLDMVTEFAELDQAGEVPSGPLAKCIIQLESRPVACRFAEADSIAKVWLHNDESELYYGRSADDEVQIHFEASRNGHAYVRESDVAWLEHVGIAPDTSIKGMYSVIARKDAPPVAVCYEAYDWAEAVYIENRTNNQIMKTSDLMYILGQYDYQFYELSNLDCIELRFAVGELKADRERSWQNYYSDIIPAENLEEN